MPIWCLQCLIFRSRKAIYKSVSALADLKIWKHQKDILKANWHHGLTCFGGPAVQVQTFHDKFVDDLGWIDESMYQQIFCLSQALPGSVSVKMLFCINAIHSGMGAGLLASLVFALPGAIGMYVLALGISQVGSTLPKPVYALLSGLNAATVGIIALAGVRLASRAITDRITRFWVYLSCIMGILYSALWYYPVLLIGAGCTTLLWDLRYPHACAGYVKKLVMRWRPPQKPGHDVEQQSSTTASSNPLELEKPLPALPPSSPYGISSGGRPVSYMTQGLTALPNIPWSSDNPTLLHRPVKFDIPKVSWQLGTTIIAVFIATFATMTALSALVLQNDRAFKLFASFYETGTIIVGGGPVVVPLLQTSTVNAGWVTSRDFLLGLAVIQAFPGPNLNFAIYLGALAVSATQYPSYVGASLAFVAMYAPGLFIVIGFMGLWRIMQGRIWFFAILRGINAAAIGLVFTAVYRLWLTGRLVAGGSRSGGGIGTPLSADAWLVAITATAYVGGAWFRLSPPAAILLGGAMGVGRYGIFGG